MPAPKKDKNLPNSIVEKVLKFYESDINSRIMANKKDTISVKIDGKKKKVQKRLLLCDKYCMTVMNNSGNQILKL